MWTATPPPSPSSFATRSRSPIPTTATRRSVIWEQLEDDDTPITAVENLEERLALAAEGADYEIDDQSVSMATAVVLYLASKHGHASGDRNPRELLELAARAQWRGDPPSAVADWLADRGVRG